MNNNVKQANQANDDGLITRRRQYRIISRVLKEYTSRLYRLAHLLSEFDDGRIKTGKFDLPPWTIYNSIQRIEAISPSITELTLFASQMLVHYQLDEAEAAVLRVRLADAEQALHRAQHVAKCVLEEHINTVNKNESKATETAPVATKSPPRRG